MQDIAKIIILAGAVILGFGIVLYVIGQFPGIGKLPGDIHIKRGNTFFYFPITSCIIASIVLSLIFYLFNHR